MMITPSETLRYLISTFYIEQEVIKAAYHIMKQKGICIPAVDSTMAIILLFQIMILIRPSKAVESSMNMISLPGCEDNCGGIPIPYPFGIGPNCSISGDFEVDCNTTSNGTRIPYLKAILSYSILNITISFNQARLNLPVTYHCYNISRDMEINGPYWEIESLDNPFWLNKERNRFIATGCNTVAYLHLDFNNDLPVGCLSTCNSRDSLNKYGPSCSGIACCRTEIPMTTNYFYIFWDENFNNSQVYNFTRCSYAMVTEDTGSFDTNYITSDELIDQRMPAVFDWTIGNTTCKDAQSNASSYTCRSDHSACFDYVNGQGYVCNCSVGYEGNPYLQGGCRDIDECVTQNPCSKPSKCHNTPGHYRCSCPFGWRSTRNDTQNPCELNLALVIGGCVGIVALSFVGFAIYFFHERRNISKVKQKYFQQHGGWILLEKIKSNQGFGFTIFTKQQVEQATNNFDSANIIGQGGHGTVYKGTVKDQTVAIKKCKIVNESKKKEFGKEMLILSQINHKNIVKLLCCCLEVEVPMLVYEFIPNGNLYHYIHRRKQGSQMSLTTRLRIAHESAEALAYLHTSASPPIFHGDVKSANILLDQNYIAKVSDFRASILTPTDEAQLVTFVQGTLGYLDPEYMQTSQLTDKSDVYSFGVVLVELLTSKPVVNYDAPDGERNLSFHFLSAMSENKLQELVDDEIKTEDDIKLIEEIADLARECLNITGDERPMMKQVAEELSRISKVKQHPWGQENSPEETLSLLGEAPRHGIEMYASNHFMVDEEAEESLAAGR